MRPWSPSRLYIPPGKDKPSRLGARLSASSRWVRATAAACCNSLSSQGLGPRLRRPSGKRALFLALLLAAGMLVTLLLGLVVVRNQSWSLRRAIRGRSMRRRNYCSPMVNSNGTWVPPTRDYAGPRYLLGSTTEKKCKHRYIYGQGLLEHYLRSGLKIEVWGDSTQRQMVGSLMCWLSGIPSWKADTNGVSYLPKRKQWNEISVTENEDSLFWGGSGRCFRGSPEPRAKSCVDKYRAKYEETKEWDSELLDECRYGVLEFSWFTPRAFVASEVSADGERFAPALGWTPPTLNYRWAGKVDHLLQRVLDWLVSHPNQPFEADVLIVNAGLHLPPGSSDEEFADRLNAFFELLKDNERVFKNTDLVWIESNPVPPKNSRSFLVGENSAEVRRELGMQIARKHKVHVLRTYHLFTSSSIYTTEHDVHYSELSEHTAQLVLNMLAHNH